MRRKGKYTEEPWSNENLSHKIGGWWYQKQSKKERNTHTTDEMEGVAEPGAGVKKKETEKFITIERPNTKFLCSLISSENIYFPDIH